MSTPAPEWQHPVHVADFEKTGSVKIEAGEAERAALATRFVIPAVKSLKADLTITPEAGRFHVYGDLSADVTYRCIRTDVLFDETVESPVEGWFMDKEGTLSFAKARKKRADEEGDQPNFMEESDDPEPLENGQIDLGELAAQTLALALDLYPVSPDAPEPADDAAEPARVDNPFAVLGQLRAFMGDDEK